MLNKDIKILLIEDNPGDARFTKELLGEKGYNLKNVIHAESLEEAKRKIWELKFNVILLDLNLPDSNREETVANLYGIVEDTPIIILSGTHDDISVADSFKSGVQEFLVKGDISSNALSRCIKNAIIRHESEQELIHLNKFKDNLLSILSHDLRSPFNAIIGYLDLTIEDIGNISEDEIIANLKEIKEISYTLLHFIENLLAWSRLQNNTLKIDKSECALIDIKESSEKVMCLLARSKDIKLNYEGFDETKVWVDPDIIDSVLRNLISNALKYSPEGSQVIVKADVTDVVTIEVRDRGVGMSADSIKDIFDIGNKVVSRGTRNEKGHGIGLLICKDFIERSNGKVNIYSKLGSGTTVKFSMPKANHDA